MSKATNYRHGEVFLLRIDAMPAGKPAKHKLAIVGHSETGHHHVLESDTAFDVIEGKEKQELYLRLFEPGKLVHQKEVNRHNDIAVPSGTYKVIRKKEYDPFEKVMRDVWD